jgi:hypothetical protein
MVARGEVGLVISTILRGSQVITAEQYIIAVVVIVLTTIVTPFMLALGFHRLSQVPDTTDFALNLGIFGVTGTQQMFNVICGQIAALGNYNTAIEISEGRKVVNLEDKNVKIYYDPQNGISFRGDRKKIEEIVNQVRKAMLEEVERLPDHTVSEA